MEAGERGLKLAVGRGRALLAGCMAGSESSICNDDSRLVPSLPWRSVKEADVRGSAVRGMVERYLRTGARRARARLRMNRDGTIPTALVVPRKLVPRSTPGEADHGLSIESRLGILGLTPDESRVVLKIRQNGIQGALPARASGDSGHEQTG